MTKKKILVIDDEEENCHTLKQGLESIGGFLVWTATQGKEGISLAKAKKPDIILLDIIMPDLTGTQVAEALAEDASTQSIPIIFVTAIIRKNEIGKGGGRIGGQNFIAKPVVIKDLVQKIMAILPD